MNLSYRGIAYQSTSPTVEPIETEQTGHFLGNSYKIHHDKVAFRKTSSSLRYRGIAYKA